MDASINGKGDIGARHDRLTSSTVTITKDNIDSIAEKHFPLCMQRTLRVLRREHHLKYQARIQFVSFLANAGMDVRTQQLNSCFGSYFVVLPFSYLVERRAPGSRNLLMSTQILHMLS